MGEKSRPVEPGAERWARYKRALDGRPLPAALVDLDALDENLERMLAPVRAGGKRLRVATKSIRCPALERYVAERAGDAYGGVMTYAASETAWLAAGGDGAAKDGGAKTGARDLLLAYPTAQASDLVLLAEANRVATAAVVIDSAEHADALDRAAARAGTRIPVVIEVDLSYRPLGLGHLGVRRSPLRTVEDVVALAERVAGSAHLQFHGVMGYEAQIAGLTDAGPFAGWQNLPRRGMKRLSRRNVEDTRARLVRALAERNLKPRVVNGGGTGSVDWSSAEPALTEVTVGSGFLDGHLFDYYSGLKLRPALHYALQVVRRPAPGLVTCHGGGFIASGDGGPDRLPLPSLPEDARLLPMEGAGEVQTPVRLPPGIDLQLGDPIFFRHAKSGELAEHFNEYHLIRGQSIEATVPTYRGLGHCFLG